MSQYRNVLALYQKRPSKTMLPRAVAWRGAPDTALRLPVTDERDYTTAFAFSFRGTLSSIAIPITPKRITSL